MKGMGVTNGTPVSMGWFDDGTGVGWVENVPAGGVYTSGSAEKSRSGSWLGRSLATLPSGSTLLLWLEVLLPMGGGVLLPSGAVGSWSGLLIVVVVWLSQDKN